MASALSVAEAEVLRAHFLSGDGNLLHESLRSIISIASALGDELLVRVFS